ncbi:NepR family anti-sigma factor [Methylobacterium sp. 77]|uniref:NepR family anti-sigma factor n=1 Tax=Methylobacterium sp. 77 TaxID=1101192 RepID=UPI00047E39BF|nr:NepR family anti-sigma factor [Methylobacterium sp. 77]
MDDHETSRASLVEARSKRERGSRHHDVDTHRLSDLTQKRIGMHLRVMYDTIVQQPVPDRFRDLIARMDESKNETLDDA